MCNPVQDSAHTLEMMIDLMGSVGISLFGIGLDGLHLNALAVLDHIGLGWIGLPVWIQCNEMCGFGGSVWIGIIEVA